MDSKHAKPTPKYRSLYGYTFIECLLTLATISVVASLSTLGLLEYSKRRALLLETDRIRLLLEQAAIISLASGEEVRINLSDSALTLNRANSRSLITHRLPSEIRVQRVGSPSQAALAFYPTLAASPTTLSVNSPAGSCSITIALRTRITATC
jgi:hypothetical protein